MPWPFSPVSPRPKTGPYKNRRRQTIFGWQASKQIYGKQFKMRVFIPFSHRAVCHVLFSKGTIMVVGSFSWQCKCDFPTVDGNAKFGDH